MTVDLATGRYASFRPEWGLAVGITVGRPKFPLGYTIAAEINELKPTGLLHITDNAEFDRRFRARLDRIGVDALARRFEAIGARHGGERLVFLCFEKPGEHCHRRTWAEWWTERTGQPVPELKRGGTVHLDVTAEHIIGAGQRIFREAR